MRSNRPAPAGSRAAARWRAGPARASDLPRHHHPAHRQRRRRARRGAPAHRARRQQREPAPPPARARAAASACSGASTPRRRSQLQNQAVDTLFGLLFVTSIAVVLVGGLTILGLSAARATARAGEVSVRRAVGASLRSVRASAMLEGSWSARLAAATGGWPGRLARMVAVRGWPGTIIPWDRRRTGQRGWPSRPWYSCSSPARPAS